MTLEALQIVATAATGIFSGAAIYINVAEHPARMECGVALAATVFGPSYRRAARMQAALALVGAVAALLAWRLGAGGSWLSSGLLIFIVVPFTLIGIMPTNKRLLDPALERESTEAQDLLVRWGRLHAVRSVSSALAFIIMLVSR